MTDDERSEPEQEAAGRQRPLVRLLTRYAWRYRWWYAVGGVFLWLTNYLTVAIPVEIGRAVDALRGDLPVGRSVALIAAMGAAVIVVRTWSRIMIFNPGRHVEYNLRSEIFAKLVRLQPSFYATHTRGDIVSRASNDISWVRTLIGYGGLQVVNVTFAVILTGWQMLSLSPRLTGLVILPIAAGMVVVQWAIRRLFVLGMRSQEQLGEISDHVLGSLQGMAAIQGFVAEEAFVERFERRNREWLTTDLHLALIRSLALPLLVLAGGASVVLLIWQGGPMVLAGELTIGELAAFTALLTAFLPPLRSLGWLLSVIQRGRASLERIFELVDAPIERPEGPRPVVAAAGRGPTIVVSDLSFAYPDEPGRLVLEGITATIPAGAVVGLFGRTGSGKSTFLRLLARLYNPPRGTVAVDGVDLLDLELDAWRRRLAMVPQRPFLFSDSVAANIALAADPSPRRLAEAVRQAALERDVATLSDGLDTVVGERGIMLSGGQRQRVALARGLYRGGDLLFLDDVLSAVDHATEAELLASIAALTATPGAPTVVIASHRLAAFRRTSLVLVLDRGRLVDAGRHEELLARPGIYRDTWLLQGQPGSRPTAAELAS